MWPVILVASGAPDKVHPYYTWNNNKIRGARWREMFKQVIDVVRNEYGVEILAIEPLNEPDFGGKFGDRDNWNTVLGKFQEDPQLSQYPIIGPSTLSADAFRSWYDAMSLKVDWGATHWIKGSTRNYIRFLRKVNNDGKFVFNSELHNLIELIIGANHGLDGATIWGGVEEVEALFAEVSENGRRIAYEVVSDKQVATAVYKLDQGNKAYIFAAGTERQALDHEFVIRCADRDVFFDGVGPQREVRIQVGKNSRLAVEVTW